MQVAAEDFDQLLQEYGALLRAHGEAQARCSEQIRAQAREIARLESQAMRLRAEVVKRDTALALAKQDRDELERAIPGLPKRLALARQVEALQARVHELSDALQQREVQAAARPRPEAWPASPGGEIDRQLEANLAAADLVICQTGCMSHGAYWRVQDHCKRTGKACVLVEDAAALHIVRIQRSGEGVALVASPQG